MFKNSLAAKPISSNIINVLVQVASKKEMRFVKSTKLTNNNDAEEALDGGGIRVEIFHTLINRIREVAKEQPDKLAVAFRSERLSYSDKYNQRIGDTANRHRSRSVAPASFTWASSAAGCVIQRSNGRSSEWPDVCERA